MKPEPDIERCREVTGGTIGCTTFCTKPKGHEGPCAWDAYEQLEWNKRAEASR